MRKITAISLLAFIFFIISLVCSLRAATANETVNVEFNNVLGPATYRASGYLGSDITDTLPSDSTFNNFWAPIKLGLFSWIRPKSVQTGGYTFPGLNRAKALNAYYQVKIYHNPGDMSLGLNSPWGKEVAAIARAASATGYSKIQLDILNEPDWSGYWPFTGNVNDPAVLEAWRIAFKSAKSVNPNIQVVGPNVGAGNIPWLKNTFLPKMKSEGNLPDILSWHEINTPINQIANNVDSMRNYLSQNGMTQVKDVSINEYNYTDSYLQPGLAVQFISQLEKARVQSASRACWEEVAGGSYDCAPHLNGLLDLGGNPRSVWWVYKSYAGMTGNMVLTSDTAGIASVASKDANGILKVLVGSISYGNVLSVRLTGLDNAVYKIKIEKIPNSGKNALGSTVILSEISQNPVNGIIEVPVSGVQSNDAHLVTAVKQNAGITLTATPTATRIPGDVNNDGTVNIFDYNILVTNYGSTTCGDIADIDGNCKVDIFDYNILVGNYGKTS